MSRHEGRRFHLEGDVTSLRGCLERELVVGDDMSTFIVHDVHVGRRCACAGHTSGYGHLSVVVALGAATRDDLVDVVAEAAALHVQLARAARDTAGSGRV